MTAEANHVEPDIAELYMSSPNAIPSSALPMSAACGTPEPRKIIEMTATVPLALTLLLLGGRSRDCRGDIGMEERRATSA